MLVPVLTETERESETGEREGDRKEEEEKGLGEDAEGGPRRPVVLSK